MARRSLFFAAFLLLATSVGALQDYRTRIAVAPMVNNTGEPQYDSVCMAVTNTVALVLRFLHNYLVIGVRQNPALADLDIDNQATIGGFCDSNRIDQLLYGSARATQNGGFVFRLQLFDNGKKQVISETQVTANTVFDVFDAADRLATQMVSHLSRVHVGFGSIRLKLAGSEAYYTVYLDGERVRNPQKLFRKVLNGSYDLEIRQARLLGDEVIFHKKIDVFENRTTTVDFAVPPASRAERDYIAARTQAILTLADDPTKISELVRAIVSFQEETSKVTYDPSLESFIKQSLAEIGKKTGAILVREVKEADGKYYARRPDFAAALAAYKKIATIVNDTYEYHASDVGDSEPLTQPYSVKAAPNGDAFTLDDKAGATFLRTFDQSGKEIAFKKLDNEGRDNRYSLAVDSDSRLYCLDGSKGAISIYNSQLKGVGTITLPGFQSSGDAKSAIAVTRDQEVFVVGPSYIAAFPFDPTEPTGVDRDAEIEGTIKATLAEYAGFTVDDAFVDSQNRLNLFSSATKEVLVFDAGGHFVRRVPFPDADAFSDVAVDRLGYYYLTVPARHTIYKYGPDGALVSSFGGYGVEPGKFSQPRSIDVGENYDIIVADYFNNRIQFVHPVSPPILLPEVSQYGILVSSRIAAAERAQRTVDNLEQRLTPMHSLLQFGGALLSFGAFAGLAFADDYLLRQSVADYQVYESATDVALVQSSRQASERDWNLAQSSFLGTLGAVGVGSALLTQSIVSALEAPVMRRETIRGLQSLSLDYRYTIDDRAYRGLRRTQLVGIWTGILPPVAGLIGAVGMPMLIPQFDVSYIPYITMASVAIPPLFSHLYAHQFNAGLLFSGLLADALAVGSYLWWKSNPPVFADTEVRYANSQATLLSTWTATVSNYLPIYLAMAAISVRLAAGIYDANHGWVSALTYNRYKAQKKSTPILQAAILPYTDGKTAFGLICSLQF